MNSRKINSLLILTLALYCLSMLPRMLSYGMFFDGVTYASISRNLSEGRGTPWAPHYTETLYNKFYEHPPLHFWLQSIAFSVFGDHVWVEAFWGFFSGLVILLLISLLWKTSAKISGAKLSGSWFPLFLFTIIPMTSWLLSSNMLEITMTIFTTAAVYFAIRSTDKLAYLYAALSGLMTLSAALVKGPVGLFPLAVPFGTWAILRNIKLKKAVGLTFIIAGSFAIALLLILLLSPDSVNFFRHYLNEQIFSSIAGKREKAGSRLSIVIVILREIIVPFGLCLITAAYLYIKRKQKIKPASSRLVLFYLFVAVSGSLPIMISPKQMGWYSFPSFPFYVLTIAALFNYIAEAVENNVSLRPKLNKGVLITGIVISLLSVFFMINESGKVRKEGDFHHDFSLQRMPALEDQIISTYPSFLAADWGLAANLQRSYKVSLSDSLGRKYLITTLDYTTPQEIKDKYHKIYPADPVKYIIFERNK